MRAGRDCPEHGNGYDDCSFLHRAPSPPGRLGLVPAEVPMPEEFEDHGAECLCPDPTCREWWLTNAGRSPYPDGPRR